MAILNPLGLLKEFADAIQLEGVTMPAVRHRVFTAGAPHAARKPKGLPRDHELVYAFSIGIAHGANCEAGAHRVLRVGKATSVGRLTQNYVSYPTAQALPHKLTTYKVLWPFLGLAKIGPEKGTNWTQWIEQSLDRDQFEIPTGNETVVKWLEKFLRGRIGSVFEG